jgi:hypothetical protein
MEQLKVDIPVDMSEPIAPYHTWTPKWERRGCDVLEAYPGQYKRLDNGMIVKVK